MLAFKEDRISNVILILVVFCVILYCISLQFLFPVLYCPDSYYHVAVSKFIKAYGFNYKFHWAQFSIFKDFFSDKDFLFHLLIVPFLYFSNNEILAGKYAIIFFNILFIFTYIWLLKKYLPNFLAAGFLLLPFLSLAFTVYFLYLRSMTLANILTIIAIYLLINKKWLKIFILSLLYPLAHISFLMLVVFVTISEIIRYLVHKEFFLRNIYAVVFGIFLGCFLHPNFPNNLLSLHLNFFLVPFYSSIKPEIDFAGELSTPPAQFVLLDNLPVFFALNFVLLMAFWTKVKASLSTLIWWACTAVYLALSFISNRHWYIANVLFFIFFASYLKDYLKERKWEKAVLQIIISAIIFVIFAVTFMPVTFRNLKDQIMNQAIMNTHYENVAYWMRQNIPRGEVVYHTFWYDSPYFICLNPKNDYILALDPILMFYPYPDKYSVYRKLANGEFIRPSEVLNKTFRVNYGFARKDATIYKQVQEDKSHFQILYENKLGIVFKVL